MERCQTCGACPAGWAAHFPNLGIDRCGECASLSCRHLTEPDASKLYAPEYFQGGEYLDYKGHRRVHELNFSAKWRLLAPYLRPPIRLVEIGCAYGFFVDYACRQGAQRALGIDVHPEVLEYARRHNRGEFARAGEKGTPFPYNLLVLWDVFEHLQTPLDTLEEWVGGLEPGGIMALTTVDSSAWVARMRGVRWRQIHPPTHLHYPTFRGLEQTLRRLGMRMLAHGTFGYYRALEVYLQAIGLGGLGRWFPWLRQWPVRLDLKDTQLIIGQKPE